MPHVDSGGIRIHYELRGSGLPLVLLHGSLMDGRSWELAGYVDHLSAEFALALLDCRGAGDSDRPHDPDAYPMERYVADVIAVADDAGFDRFALWGFSWGAAIAWSVAEMHSERVKSSIVQGHWDRRLLTNRDVVEKHRIGPLLELGGAGFYDLTEPEEGPLPAWFRDQFAATDVEAYVAARRAAFSWPELEPERIEVPTLLLNGSKEDPKRRSAAVAASMPNARAEILEGLTHCRAFVASEITGSVVTKWLNSDPTGR